MKEKIYNIFMGVMSRLMLSCESAGILLSRRQHQKLNFHQKISLKVHLLSCSLCKRFEEDLIILEKGLDQYKACHENNCILHHLSEDQKKSISQVIEDQAAS